MRFSIPKQFIVPSVVQESECLMQECHQAQIPTAMAVGHNWTLPANG